MRLGTIPHGGNGTRLSVDLPIMLHLIVVIAAETPGLPIVLCTIFPTPVLETEIGHCGIRAVVDKAKAGSELVDTVEKALADPPLRAFAAH